MQSHSPSNAPLNTRGFTLLEVLISMAILVFISFGIYQATTETYKLRDVLSTEGDFYNSVRLSMSILERDIALIYSPLILMDPKDILPIGAPPFPEQPNEDLNRSFTYWSRAQNPQGMRLSRFIGTENQMSFVSVSYGRLYKDTPGADFTKISYKLIKDEKNPRHDTFILVKTENANAFGKDDSDRGSNAPLIHTHELLSGIKKLSFLYDLREGATWKKVRSWDSDVDSQTAAFPDVIEINLEVVSQKNLSFEGRYKFRREIPIHGLPGTF